MSQGGDDVSEMTSALSVSSVVICAVAVSVLIVLAGFFLARRKRLLLSTRYKVIMCYHPVLLEDTAAELHDGQDDPRVGSGRCSSSKD